MIKEIFKGDDEKEENVISTRDSVILNASQGETKLGSRYKNPNDGGLTEELIPIKKKKVEMHQEG